MRLVHTIAAALLLLLPAHAGGRERAEELLRRLDTSTPQARESAARALAALGPAALGELFALIGPQAEGPRDETLALAIGDLRGPALLELFGGFTRAALPAERLPAALLVLREAGCARDLARCLELADEGRGALQAELAAALGGICARDPAACGQALALARGCSEPGAEALARGLAEARSTSAARALVQLAVDRPGLAPVSFSCLLAEADALPRPADADLLSALRELLGREEHPAAQELLLLTGRLGDDEAVPQLIESLSSAQPALRADALWSLRRITGLGLGADAQAWKQWFGEETQWWKERSGAVLALLRGEDAGAQRRALGELGGRFWHRQQIAAELGEYLGRCSAEGARMACGILARLDCPAAIPLLQARLCDPDPGVQQSARAALASLTGKKIPSRPVGLRAAPRTPVARQ